MFYLVLLPYQVLESFETMTYNNCVNILRYVVIAVVERNKETCARTVRHFVPVVSVPAKTRQTVAVLKRRENCTNAGRQMVAMVQLGVEEPLYGIPMFA